MSLVAEQEVVKDDPSNRLYARIRKRDEVIRNHFTSIDGKNRAKEIRRLLEKAILEENKAI